MIGIALHWTQSDAFAACACHAGSWCQGSQEVELRDNALMLSQSQMVNA